MSFLNPVNEPVRRFSSADVGAPQINYAARTAGDVKSVLKACLVTGYGDTASAGWAAVNEIGNVIEFVSPSAAMSDYRLGINDTSASNTTWYYQYQDARVDMATSSINKNHININKSSLENGWQLIVSARGVVFINTVFNTTINGLAAGVVYWGQVKSNVAETTAQNIAWFAVGHATPNDRVSDYFTSDTAQHYRLQGLVLTNKTCVLMDTLKFQEDYSYPAVAEINTPLYLTHNHAPVAQMPGFLLQVKNTSDANKNKGVLDQTLGNRPVVTAFLGRDSNNFSFIGIVCHSCIVIHLDYWEY